jgi:prepilin-type processing-associated H-X9-DG protein
MYSQENNGKTQPRFPLYPVKTQIWLGAIYPYHESPTLIQCPSVTHLSTDVAASNVFGSHKTGWAGDSGYWKYGGHKGRGSYAINAWTWSRDIDGVPTNATQFYRSLADAEKPHNTPLFLDSSWITAQGNRNQSPTSMDGSDTGNIARVYLDRHHQKKVNYAMLDGSAKTLKINKLYYLDWSKNFQYRDLPLL